MDEPIVVMIREHRQVITVLDHPNIRPLTKQYASWFTKYFGSYLAKSFPKSTCREIIKFHHQYLLKQVTPSFFAEIAERNVLLWREIIGDNGYSIYLSSNLEWPTEGDLKLTLSQNNTPIYELCFTKVPGRLIDFSAEQVLLIANVQGALGKLEQIRQAMKACNHVAPPFVLMAAAELIAGVLSIDVIGGVSNGEHLARTEKGPPEFFFDYDSFWALFAARREVVGIYEIAVPLPVRPLAQIKSNQRRRAAQKHEFRERVRVSVAATFAHKFKKATESPTPIPQECLQ